LVNIKLNILTGTVTKISKKAIRYSSHNCKRLGTAQELFQVVSTKQYSTCTRLKVQQNPAARNTQHI